jgi:hypothetical protein
MARLGKCFTLCLVVVLVVSSLLLIESTKAQVENVRTSCNITITDILEGQPIPCSIQIYPAPPEGEVFNNISVTIVSPMQGVWGNGGNGPWNKANIATDSNGRATVNFDITTFSGYWNAILYFGGQTFANKSLYYQPSSQQINFNVYTPETPPPTPPSHTPLGPVEIHSSGGGGHSVLIFAPQNNSFIDNPVQLVFCVRALLLPYCYSSVGNIGYSLDNGVINSVNDFLNQTIVHQADSDDATVWVNMTLPALSEGPHTITVYWGWYFVGSNQRYEVSAYQTVVFNIGSSFNPSPTVPEFPITVTLVTVLAFVSLLLVMGKRKLTIEHIL